MSGGFGRLEILHNGPGEMASLRGSLSEMLEIPELPSEIIHRRHRPLWRLLPHDGVQRRHDLLHAREYGILRIGF
jgi:hypothetical protein